MHAILTHGAAYDMQTQLQRAATARRQQAAGKRWVRCRCGTSPISIPSRLRRRSPRDLEGRRRRGRRIKETYQGKLVALAADGAALAEAIEAYERLSELIGRLGSYAGLLYAGDTADPEHAKFYGDIQEKITAITTGSDLLRAGAQPDRRGGDWPARCRCRRLARYKPWIDDLRKEKPYQLEEKLERLFHEKAITVARRLEPAVQRDHDRAALRGGRRARAAGARADAELPDVDPDEQQARRRGRGAGQGVQGQHAPLHADHQHAGQGQGDLRPLARLQGRGRQPASGQPRRAPRWWSAGRQPCAPPIRAPRTATTR